MMMQRVFARAARAPVAASTQRRWLSDKIAPFHLAIPVHDLKTAQKFYGDVLGFTEGRSSTFWQDYNMLGHQLVVHEVNKDYKAPEFHNPVDADDVPVPHFGVALTVDDFHSLADRLKKSGVQFIIEPHLRFQGRKGEQWTMFFKDPSGNSLEFKAMTTPENLFAKYVEN
ncbi:hypothetical protein Poli38472_007412 [Pythium oligandrum]|uniref:VOC domain-containing protein n=1 Tax=Pythium oligandrum TaxID=41045 RepID=A0A8K1FL16_PYTOL|nr:hypothetical protein Poli38472_007412 [Pythium oligandrum]|eukprot:TMW67740.1 hypothetical protein Poli38472_007412 [Pythium oligandrum]